MQEKRVKEILDIPKSKFEIYLARDLKKLWKLVKEGFFITTEYAFCYKYKDKTEKNMHIAFMLLILGLLYVSALMSR